MPAVDQRLLELILSQSTLTKAVTLPFFILYLHHLSLKKLHGMESMFRSFDVKSQPSLIVDILYNAITN